MGANYEKIIRDNLHRAYARLPHDLEEALPAKKEGDLFHFAAFGENCCITPDQINLSGRGEDGPKGLLISLYANQAHTAPIQLEPFNAFRDLPGSMPYQAAFTANSEKILVPHVAHIIEEREIILNAFFGDLGPEDMAGDLSIVLYPLPKIALCYIFYLPDEEFPASVTCLFSNNALSFIPLDGLADVAEYTSKTIIDLLKGNL